MSKLTLTKGTVRRVACPVCKAEPGNWCRLSRGKHKGLLIDECHKARAVLAALDEDKSYAKAKRAAAKHNHKGGDLGLISAAINPVKPVSRYQTERENKVMAQMDSLRPVASFAIGDIVEIPQAHQSRFATSELLEHVGADLLRSAGDLPNPHFVHRTFEVCRTFGQGHSLAEI